MAATRRGICSVCGGEFAVTMLGGMRDHRGDISVGGWRQTCEGVGKPPTGAAPDPIAEAEARGYQLAISRLRNRADVERMENPNNPTMWAVFLSGADYLEHAASTSEERA